MFKSCARTFAISVTLALAACAPDDTTNDEATDSLAPPQTVARPQTGLAQHAAALTQSATSVELLHFGAGSSAADQQSSDNAQGASTTLRVSSSDAINAGGCHYYWVAQDLNLPGDDRFLQLGYARCAGEPNAVPFLYSIVGSDETWIWFNDFPLAFDTWYTFQFSTNGVKRADGKYTWSFYLQPKGQAKALLKQLAFETPNAHAPYIVSELNGSADGCGDVIDVSYGQGAALKVLKYGLWWNINHANAYYGYGPCSNSNVVALGYQQLETVLSPSGTASTVDGQKVW